MTEPAPTLTLDDVRAAAARIAGHLPVTPTEASPRLSEITGCSVVLKLENQHLTGSFKERGALNKLLSLGEADRRAGVIAMSAGNHAQAVACHTTRLGIRSVIVMPSFTPFTKVERTESLGARVELHGETLSDAAAYAQELAAREGLTFVHPYDDPLIAAGQGTAALELLDAAPDLEMLVVPVGGGGLLAGMAAGVKARKPSVTVVGVRLARRRGPTLADGIAVDALGKLPQALLAGFVDALVEVEEVEVAAAMRTLHGSFGMVAEGAGAAAVAALLAGKVPAEGRTVAVLSGRNVDPGTLMRTLGVQTLAA